MEAQLNHNSIALSTWNGGKTFNKEIDKYIFSYEFFLSDLKND